MGERAERTSVRITRCEAGEFGRTRDWAGWALPLVPARRLSGAIPARRVGERIDCSVRDPLWCARSDFGLWHFRGACSGARGITRRPEDYRTALLSDSRNDGVRYRRAAVGAIAGTTRT